MRDSDADDGEDNTNTSSVSDANKDRISDALKRVYDDVASEPLPDELAKLLEQLKSGNSK